MLRRSRMPRSYRRSPSFPLCSSLKYYRYL